jgi:hypothetical protein
MGRLRTPRALALLLPLVLLLACRPTARGAVRRLSGGFRDRIPDRLRRPAVRRARRCLSRSGGSSFPLGLLARAPAWAVVGVALAATPATCTWPLPWFFFKVIDPIGNRAELAVIRRGLTPLVED